ncbi:ABC transporter permease [Rathayibacter soli]|uniref:ABC transporter permease n=1 Tax=Rathayibacter soli TaxID=3144168 RepID=UPI0027E545B5|nr:ABC transporter permease subunit [Glaciibacter superstes]
MTLLRPFSHEVGILRSPGRLAADAIVLMAVVVSFYVAISLSHGILSPFTAQTAPTTVSTNPWDLPYYAARSLFRMFVALAVSVIFSLIYATAAARSRRAGAVLIPILDILQSVPVLGFLSVTLTVWLTLFPNNMLGLECASIFAIFTSQVWNMTFAFYQSLITQPRDLDEAARLLRLTKWQRFWNLDVPGGMIPLVWNGMMSFGGGWFFLVASEVISVNNKTYALPGIGSYVATAADDGDIGKILLASAVMVIMVIGVNFVFWRPLTAWAERFRNEDSESGQGPRSLVFDVLRRSRLPHLVGLTLRPVSRLLDAATRPFGIADVRMGANLARRRAGDIVFWSIVGAAVLWGAIEMLSWTASAVGLAEWGHAFLLGLATFARVIVLLFFATIVWVPIGVWIGMNPRVSRLAQPIVQVLASFPANFLFPIVTAGLVATGISLNWGGILLMALGAQWYILFNVIAGASAIPNDLREASANLRLGRGLRWRTLILPAIFSAYVTGGITAAGGAWNASIVAEVVSYNGHTLTAIGLGAYITEASMHGDAARTLIGVAVMSVFVVSVNRLFWRRLYRLAETRFSF